VKDATAELEARLDSFDPAERDQALDDLLALVRRGEVRFPAPEAKVNLHAHSFYSYNALGYSPAHIVWRARREGLRAVGLVDFDVFDGVDEFHRAGERLGIPTVAGMETRAYIPEFAQREINSPGEPGIAYHMVVGLARSAIEPAEARQFAERLRHSARRRNQSVVQRVNAYLDPVALDYEADVLPLSPSGTPTERHLCAAYEAKAEAVYPDPDTRARFWSDRLGAPAAEVAAILGDSRRLQALIRSKTMKQGGVGYQTPAPETFPRMADVNRFALAVGGIPAATWLDGTSPGEQAIEELLDLHQAAGSAALNIIPDRNWNVADPKTKAVKVANLYRVVGLAGARGLPLSVGTEMNAPGLKFVDDFDAPELAPVVESFLHGAAVLVGHTAAVLAGEPPYTSAWAARRFGSAAEKNAHFARRGQSWRKKDSRNNLYSI
jgi:hypothetical protein